MSKQVVTRIWLAGVILLAAGLLVCAVSVGLLLVYGGHFVGAPSGNGYDFAPTVNGYFWTMMSLIVLGSLLAVMGGVIQLVAWVGAVINTSRLADRTWFLVVLIGGLLGLATGVVGFATMVAYVLAGPDGMSEGRQVRVPTSQTRVAPTS